MRSFATYSIKGGVGKTTAAVNLAWTAAEAGTRVLVWDLDPQGAASWMLRVEATVKGGAERLVGKRGELARHLRASAHPSVDVMPADFSLRHLDVELDDLTHPVRRLRALLDALDDRYDLAILDCPPSISLASESVFAAVDALVVPTIASTLSVRALLQLRDVLATWPEAPIVLPFVSMFDQRRTVQRATLDVLRRDVAGLARSVIPAAAVVERMADAREPLAQLAPRAAATLAFRALWDEIAELLWR
jgi:chromosome partitioning protein